MRQRYNKQYENKYTDKMKINIKWYQEIKMIMKIFFSDILLKI